MQVAEQRDRTWRTNKPAKRSGRVADAKAAASRPAKKPGRRATRKANTAQPSNPNPPLEGSRQAVLPEWLPPQLAASAKSVPDGAGWLHEIKFDGYRLLCRIQDGEARLLTRNKQDWTHRFPHLAAAAAR